MSSERPARDPHFATPRFLATPGMTKIKGAPPRSAPSGQTVVNRLLHVLVDELRHLEHRDLALAAEDRAELVVRVDHAALLLVLQAVPLDVLPQLLGHFRSRNRAVSDDCAKRSVDLHGPHEGGIGFALRATTLRRLLARALLGALTPTLFRAALLLLGRHALSWSW